MSLLCGEILWRIWLQHLLMSTTSSLCIVTGTTWAACLSSSGCHWASSLLSSTCFLLNSFTTSTASRHRNAIHGHATRYDTHCYHSLQTAKCHQGALIILAHVRIVIRVVCPQKLVRLKSDAVHVWIVYVVHCVHSGHRCSNGWDINCEVHSCTKKVGQSTFKYKIVVT